MNQLHYRGLGWTVAESDIGLCSPEDDDLLEADDAAEKFARDVGIHMYSSIRTLEAKNREEKKRKDQELYKPLERGDDGRVLSRVERRKVRRAVKSKIIAARVADQVNFLRFLDKERYAQRFSTLGEIKWRDAALIMIWKDMEGLESHEWQYPCCGVGRSGDSVSVLPVPCEHSSSEKMEGAESAQGQD